jgi:hypothetical protein
LRHDARDVAPSLRLVVLQISRMHLELPRYIARYADAEMLPAGSAPCRLTSAEPIGDFSVPPSHQPDGTAFSLLPATGNCVKIVQRVPVKIVMDDPPTDVALGPGMSAVPTVRIDPTPSLFERLRGGYERRRDPGGRSRRGERRRRCQLRPTPRAASRRPHIGQCSGVIRGAFWRFAGRQGEGWGATSRASWRNSPVLGFAQRPRAGEAGDAWKYRGVDHAQVLGAIDAEVRIEARLCRAGRPSASRMAYKTRIISISLRQV